MVLDAARLEDPVSPGRAAAAAVRVGEPAFVEGVLHWLAALPEDGGASCLFAADRAGPRRASPQGVSVRSSLYDYGAGAWCATPDGPVGIEQRSGALGWLDRAAFEPIGATGSSRLGDLAAVPMSGAVLAVEESADPWAASLVAVDCSSGARHVLRSTGELLAEPCVAPDGRRVAWLAWPRGTMPWDAAAVWVGELDLADGQPALRRPRRVDGGRGCSTGSPTWRGDGTLAYTSEAAGWWQPFVCDDGGAVRRLCGRRAEFQRPRWLTCRWLAACGPDGALACGFADADGEHVGTLGADGTLAELEQPCVRIDGVAADGAHIGWVGAGVGSQGVVCLADAASLGAATCREVVAPAAPRGAPVPERFSFSRDGVELDGVLWRPTSHPHAGVAPLVLSIHPGPTGATDHSYAPLVHLLCASGFAVASLDASGSTAHGRTHRERLNGRFGVLDVEECAAALEHLVDVGVARSDARFARGTSSGGTTALLLLATGSARGAVAWYPASSFADRGEGFESGYLSVLVGDDAERRSPRRRAGELRGDVLLVQGTEDPVVPMEETVELAAALRGAGVATELVALDGEGHGLRSSAARATALTAELEFYLARVVTERGGAARYDATSAEWTSSPPPP